MSYAKEFDWIPISDSTPEFHFGNSGPVNMWIEFQKSDLSLWRGSFECGETNSRHIIKQADNEFIIIASGIGYRIKNETNSLKSKINLDDIIFGTRINDYQCLLANWMGFYILDSNDELTELRNLNTLDWIEILDENDKRILGEFDSSRYQWKRKKFEFDKTNQQLTI